MDKQEVKLKGSARFAAKVREVIADAQALLTGASAPVEQDERVSSNPDDLKPVYQTNPFTIEVVCKTCKLEALSDLDKLFGVCKACRRAKPTDVGSNLPRYRWNG